MTFFGFPLSEDYVRLVWKLYEAKKVSSDAALELLWYFK